MNAPEAAAVEGGGGGSEPSYHVLLLYSESRLTPSVISADRAFRVTLEALVPGVLHFYTEFLDLNSANGRSLSSELRELFRAKYKGRRIDLIVAQGQLTVPFVLENRVEIFSSAPVVFVGVEPSTFADLSLVSVITGTWRRRGWRETLDLALRLHPRTRQAVVIVGSSRGERLWVESARQQLAEHGKRIEISYWVDWRFEDLLEAAANLATDTVVLAGPLLRDGTGRDFATPSVIGRIAAVSGAPVYGLTEASIGTGAIGGHVLSFEAHGRVAAELAARVIAGEHPSPTAAGTTVPTFDDRQIARWRIGAPRFMSRCRGSRVAAIWASLGPTSSFRCRSRISSVRGTVGPGCHVPRCCSPTTTPSCWKGSRACCATSSRSSGPWPTGPA